MFYSDSASFDNLQISGSLIGTLSASINLTNTELTASIISASSVIGNGLNARPANVIYGVNTTAYSVVSTSSVDEIAHVYTLPANYFKVGDAVFFTWEATTGETAALTKQYKTFISLNSSSIAGAAQWGQANIIQNIVSLQMGKYGYITSNTTMKILGAGTTAATSIVQMTAFPTDVTVPHISSSWNIILTANRSGTDTTRVEWSYLQITRF
jgi:hypothetical protein